MSRQNLVDDVIGVVVVSDNSVTYRRSDRNDADYLRTRAMSTARQYGECLVFWADGTVEHYTVPINSQVIVQKKS